MFNTLKYANLLEEVGFTRTQAETSVKILVEIMEEKLASKEDLQNAKTELKQDMKAFKVAIQNQITLSEAKMTMRLGGIVTAALVILTAIHKYV